MSKKYFLLLSLWTCPTGCSHWWFGWSTRWKMILWHRHLVHQLSHNQSPMKPNLPAHRIHHPDKPKGHLHHPVKQSTVSPSLSARTLHCVGLFARNGAGVLHKKCTNKFPVRQYTKSSTKKFYADTASKWCITEPDRYMRWEKELNCVVVALTVDNKNYIYRSFEGSSQFKRSR